MPTKSGRSEAWSEHSQSGSDLLAESRRAPSWHRGQVLTRVLDGIW